MSPERLPPAGTTVAEGSSLEDVSLKAARLTVEERREKIHRYIKKWNEHNFSKKITIPQLRPAAMDATDGGRVFFFAPQNDLQYACRKTLADSRPRVRSRFAKNDDYGEPSSRGMPGHEEYEQMGGMKEDDMLDSDTLQAHLSGMNSYMYNHTVESWI